jgi:hypothetical protein
VIEGLVDPIRPDVVLVVELHVVPWFVPRSMGSKRSRRRDGKMTAAVVVRHRDRSFSLGVAVLRVVRVHLSRFTSLV